MDVDEFYRQPAAVPFKWEIKPGVPRNHHRLHQFPSHCPPPQKLKPPPAGSHVLRPSNSTASRTRSDRWLFDRPNLVEPPQVSSGCFPSPLPNRNRKSGKSVNRKTEPDYASESETLSRWSISSRKSISPFRESVSSSPSSFSSYRSSPYPTSETEWAGFGLF